MKQSRSNDCPYRDQCSDPKDKMVVYGGPIDADVVVLGQSPGESEEIEGKPFIGPAGQELRKTLRAVGFDDTQILFTNACMCKPTDNATPPYKQVKLCRPNLWEVLEAHPRKLIIALGNEAWSALHLEAPGGVTKRCGQIRAVDDLGGTPSISTYHPSYVLRDPKHSTQFYRDLETAKVFCDKGNAPEPDQVSWELYHPDYGGPLPDKYIPEIERSPWLVVDVETTGTSDVYDQLLGVGLGFETALGSRHYLYVSLLHGDDPVCPWSIEEWLHTYRWLTKAIASRPEQRLLAHNIKFEARMLLRQLGIDIRPIKEDVMLDVYLMDPTRSAGLKESATFYLKAPRWDESWRDDNDKPVAHYMSSPSKHLGMVPVDVVAQYCVLDCHYTVQMAEYVRSRMRPKLQQFYAAVLSPLLQNTLDIELEGIPLDCNGLIELGKLLDAAEAETQTLIGSICGNPDINTNSPKQLASYLYGENKLDKLFSYFVRTDGRVTYFDDIDWGGGGLDPGRKYGLLMGDVPDDLKPTVTDVVDRLPEFRKGTGGLSTSHAVCKYLLHELTSARHPDVANPVVVDFLNAVLHYRKLSKLNGTYVKSWLEHSAWDGKLHPSFLLHGTETGRASSADPNLQNVPKEMTQYIQAPQGWVVCEADFAQLELRVWAHYSACPNLLEVLTSEDFHRYAMGQALGKAPADITEAERSAGKVIVFGGLMYGGGANIIAKQTGLSYTEASEKLQQYRQAFPVGAYWLEAQIAFARENLYVESDTGRRRALPGILSDDKSRRTISERQATNTAIQGTAADITFIALNRVVRSLSDSGMEAKLINTVHDSIILLCPESEMMDLYCLLKEQMTRPPYRGFTVPLDVEIEFRRRWKTNDLDLSFVVDGPIYRQSTPQL